jgi:hypothetical protein
MPDTCSPANKGVLSAENGTARHTQVDHLSRFITEVETKMDLWPLPQEPRAPLWVLGFARPTAVTVTDHACCAGLMVLQVLRSIATMRGLPWSPAAEGAAAASS